MARKNTNTNTENTQATKAVFGCPYKILRPHWMDDNKVCFFDLELLTANGPITLYGLRLLYSKDEKPFISPASHQGKDKKWYGFYYIPMADEMAQAIITELEGM